VVILLVGCSQAALFVEQQNREGPKRIEKARQNDRVTPLAL
jgi:hypothetical protein